MSCLEGDHSRAASEDLGEPPSHLPRAYIDESGDAVLSSLNRGASDYFVVSAVVVSSGDHEEFEQVAEKARDAFFPGGEIKSSKLKKHPERRRALLRTLGDAPFLLHLLAVNKHAIDPTSGLQFKRSFLKFIQRKLYTRLFRARPELQVLADEHGGDEFMRGFREYMRRHHPMTLFSAGDVRFVDSEEWVGVQVADLMAGTFRTILKEKDYELLQELREVLSDRLATMHVWPPEPPVPARELSESDAQLDAAVREYSFRVAAERLSQLGRLDDEDSQLQSLVLEYLLTAAQWSSDERYVSTGELVDRVAKVTGQKLPDVDFRGRAIAALRDDGVLIASGRSGYKIPVRVSELDTFVGTADQIIRPLIRRVQSARGDLLTATGGKLDILERPGLSYLREVTILSPGIEGDRGKSDALDEGGEP